MSRIIMPLACHFKGSTSVCQTTIVRMHTALAIAQTDDIILLGGDVPHSLGGPTLGLLMRDWFVERGIASDRLRFVKKVYGTFSEARAACKIAKELGDEELIVISSPWYFFAGALIWNSRAKENGISLHFISVPHTGGWRTWILYGAIGLLIRTTIALGMEDMCERFFTEIQKSRAEGFTLNGCA